MTAAPVPAEDAAELIARNAATARTSAQNVPSPCLSVCRMGAGNGLCDGCFRTLDEIAGWSRMADADKRRIWGLVEARARQQIEARSRTT